MFRQLRCIASLLMLLASVSVILAQGSLATGGASSSNGNVPKVYEWNDNAQAPYTDSDYARLLIGYEKAVVPIISKAAFQRDETRSLRQFYIEILRIPALYKAPTDPLVSQSYAEIRTTVENLITRFSSGGTAQAPPGASVPASDAGQVSTRPVGQQVVGMAAGAGVASSHLRGASNFPPSMVPSSGPLYGTSYKRLSRQRQRQQLRPGASSIQSSSLVAGPAGNVVPLSQHRSTRGGQSNTIQRPQVTAPYGQAQLGSLGQQTTSTVNRDVPTVAQQRPMPYASTNSLSMTGAASGFRLPSDASMGLHVVQPLVGEANVLDRSRIRQCTIELLKLRNTDLHSEAIEHLQKIGCYLGDSDRANLDPDSLELFDEFKKKQDQILNEIGSRQMEREARVTNAAAVTPSPFVTVGASAPSERGSNPTVTKFNWIGNPNSAPLSTERLRDAYLAVERLQLSKLLSKSPSDLTQAEARRNLQNQRNLLENFPDVFAYPGKETEDLYEALLRDQNDALGRLPQ